MSAPTFAQVKRVEGLVHSLTMARDRRRKGLTLHADEIPSLLEALGKAAKMMDAARLAAIGSSK